MKTTMDFTHKGTAALHCLGMPKKIAMILFTIRKFKTFSKKSYTINNKIKCVKKELI